MKYFLGTLVLTLFISCTEDFADINENPNTPASVQPDLLFRQVLYGYGNDMGREGFTGGALLGQYFAMTDFNLFDRHALSSPQEGGNPWPILYTALRDIETVLETSRSNPAAGVYEGPALVIKAYLAMNLTDLYGDVPYFEAFSARSQGVAKPGYDTQEEIYNGLGGILDNLERAVEMLDERLDNQSGAGGLVLGGDLLFNGELAAWVRFANSLRIKALLRISDRRDPSADLMEILGDGRIMSASGEDATFRFAASPPNSFPIAEVRQGIFDVYLMSETAAEVLSGLDDDRVDVLYLSQQADGGFAGIRNGIVGGSPVTPDTFARPGLIWRENTGDLRFNYLTSWEIDFCLAEAALRGFIEGDAEAYYESGVRKAFEYWHSELPAAYLENGQAAFVADNEEEALKQIITQKWIANIGNAYEGWNEWRRTGYPELRPVEASLNEGVIPTRLPYPNEEQALNSENYRLAAERTEGNSVNSRVWWDVE